MLEGVTIEQLRTLRAVAQEGSFSAAARRLGRVQAAVSQSIERLEAQLGLRLFDRTGRLPQLTAHGEQVVAAAARVHEDIEALDSLVAALKTGAETSLSLVVDTMLPTAILVDFAHDFSREHGGVELTVGTETLSSVTDAVRGKQAQLGIALEDADLSGLTSQHLTHVRMLPVAAPSHPLAALAGPLEAAALADPVQIVLAERGARASDDDRGVFARRTWQVVDLATKRALIAGGLGWGHMPEHQVRDDIDAGRLVELRLAAWGDDPPRRALVLVQRAGAVLGPVARWAKSQLTRLCHRG